MSGQSDSEDDAMEESMAEMSDAPSLAGGKPLTWREKMQRARGAEKEKEDGEKDDG